MLSTQGFNQTKFLELAEFRSAPAIAYSSHEINLSVKDNSSSAVPALQEVWEFFPFVGFNIKAFNFVVRFNMRVALAAHEHNHFIMDYGSAPRPQGRDII